MKGKNTKSAKIAARTEMLRYLSWFTGGAITGLRNRLPPRDERYEECVKQIEDIVALMNEQLREEILRLSQK